MEPIYLILLVVGVIIVTLLFLQTGRGAGRHHGRYSDPGFHYPISPPRRRGFRPSWRW